MRQNVRLRGVGHRLVPEPVGWCPTVQFRSFGCLSQRPSRRVGADPARSQAVQATLESFGRASDPVGDLRERQHTDAGRSHSIVTHNRIVHAVTAAVVARQVSTVENVKPRHRVRMLRSAPAFDLEHAAAAAGVSAASLRSSIPKLLPRGVCSQTAAAAAAGCARRLWRRLARTTTCGARSVERDGAAPPGSGPRPLRAPACGTESGLLARDAGRVELRPFLLLLMVVPSTCDAGLVGPAVLRRTVLRFAVCGWVPSGVAWSYAPDGVAGESLGVLAHSHGLRVGWCASSPHQPQHHLVWVWRGSRSV